MWGDQKASVNISEGEEEMGRRWCLFLFPCQQDKKSAKAERSKGCRDDGKQASHLDLYVSLTGEACSQLDVRCWQHLSVIPKWLMHRAAPWDRIHKYSHTVAHGRREILPWLLWFRNPTHLKKTLSLQLSLLPLPKAKQLQQVMLHTLSCRAGWSYHPSCTQCWDCAAPADGDVQRAIKRRLFNPNH